MSANPASDASDAASATPSHSVSSPFSPHAAAFGPSTPLNLGASNRLHGLSSDGHSLSSRASSFASSHGRALSPAAKAASPFANAENSHTSAAFYGFGDRLRDAIDHSRQSSGGAHNNLSATSPATPSLLSGSAASRRAPSPSPRSLAAGADSTYPSTDFLGQSQSSLPNARSPNSLVPPSAASDLQRRFSSSFGAQGDAASPTLLDAPTNGARPPFGRQSFSDGPAASDHQHSAEITSALMESHHSSSSGGFPTATHPANLHNLSDPASLRPDPSLPLPAAAPTPTTGPLSASDPRTQLLVSNLPYRVRWQDLKDLFRKAGTVLRADVSLSADNRSRGYGTVLMATEQDAIKAADMLGGFTWQGRTLDVRVDRSGTLVGVAGSAAMPTIAPNNLRANANAMPAMLGNYANGHSPMAHALDQSANQPFLGVPEQPFTYLHYLSIIMNAPIELLKRAGNEALRVNPTVADIDITTHGSDWLWAVFSVMAATGLGTMIWSLKLSRGERAFHYLSAAILATASVAYFSMASDLGATPVRVEFTNYGPAEVNGARPTRSIWYARYIDWTITTPLLLLEILLVSGLPLSTIFVTIFFDLVMIITGLIGALVQSTYKWGYYTMGCVAMFYVFWVIYGPGLKSAAHLGDDFKKAYLYSALLLTVLWTLYPIAWGLADGSNTISPDGEMVFYGVLDLLAKPVFALFHMFALRKCNYSSLHLKSGKFSDYEDLAGNHARAIEAGKASEAGLAGSNGTVNGTGIGNGVGNGTNTLEPAPAMRQAHATQ